MKSMFTIRSMAAALIGAAAAMGNAVVDASARRDRKHPPKHEPRAYRLRTGDALAVNSTDSRQVRRWKTRMQHKGAAIASEHVQGRMQRHFEKSAVMEKIDDARKNKVYAKHSQIGGFSGAKLMRKATAHKIGYAGLR